MQSAKHWYRFATFLKMFCKAKFNNFSFSPFHMMVVHHIGAHVARKEIQDDPRFMLVNRRGSFLYWKNNPDSRYQGFFVRLGGVLARTLAGVRLSVDLPIYQVTNHYSHFEIERAHGFKETFLLDEETDSFVWSANETAWLSVHMDAKEIFDNDEWERFYEVSNEAHMVVIECVKRKNETETLHFFMAIAGDAEYEYEIKKEWITEEYALDQARNDPPFSRTVFSAVRIKGKHFVFSVSADKEEAKRNARRLCGNSAALMNKREEVAHRFAAFHDQPIKNPEVRAAYCAAKWSLSRMAVCGSGADPEGLYAGMPWLAQFWLRDFAISAGQLDSEIAMAIFRRYLSGYAETGSITPCAGLSCIPYADTEGLFFLLAQRLDAQGFLTSSEREQVKILCVRYVDEELPRRMKDGFVRNGRKETWMDTEYKTFSRSGARIEIQALALASLAYAAKLTGEKKYTLRREAFLRSVRGAFWDGETLADGLADRTFRPNIFLAFHFAPDVLFKHEWTKAFSAALTALWLPWGGIASLSKSHPFFCGIDRGCADPNQSYHHGDAWFFINNLAAAALFQVDAKKFSRFINALLAASTEDILWKGMLGHHSEVSSANEFAPGGCLAQSWSAATYCGAVDVILKSRII